MKQSKNFFVIISQVFFSLLALRRKLYQWKYWLSLKVKVPVISIGNISLGGSGKTPVTLRLAQLLEEMELNVVILTRGYKGRSEKSSLILDQSNLNNVTAQLAGDEPFLLAKNLRHTSVIIGRQRRKNLQKYLTQQSADVILIDDGFQHFSLQRDLDIVLINSLKKDHFFHHLLNAREPMSALDKAHVVLFTHEELLSQSQKHRLRETVKPFLSPEAFIGSVDYEALGFFTMDGDLLAVEKLIAANECMSFAGLASDLSFQQSLFKILGKHSEHKSLGDHYNYQQKTLVYLKKKAEKHDFLITTEKDIVKLDSLCHDQDLRKKIVYLKIGAKIKEEKELIRCMAQLFDKKKRRYDFF